MMKKYNNFVDKTSTTLFVQIPNSKFEDLLNDDIGRIIVVNRDNSDECLVYYVTKDEGNDDE